MAKSAIDAEVNNQIFRKDWSAIIAYRRDLATIQPVRLAYSAAGYTAGQVLARVTTTGGGFTAGQFGKWSAVSGLTTDTPCVLFENVETYREGTVGVDAPSGGALARAIFAGYVYQNALIDYVASPSVLGGKSMTDAMGVSVVKF